MNLFILSILLRYIGSVVAFLLAIHIAKHWWDRLGVKTFFAYYLLRIIGLWCFCRLGGAYPGDLPEWHSMSRWIVDDHLVPGITCLTGYHLGFSYVLAAASFIWNNPFSIVFPWTICEMVAMAIFYSSLRELYTTVVAKRTLIIYLASPFCLFVSWLGAQDETFYLLFAAIFLKLYMREVHWLIHLFVSFLSVFFSKLIVPLFMVPFVLLKCWRTLLPFLGGLITYYGICLIIGLNPFDMRTTRDMSDMRTLSMLAFETQLGNVWYFLSGTPTLVQNLILLLIFAMTGLSLYPGFAEGTAKRSVFENATVLHATWFLALMLFFRINFVQYLLPLSFYLSFHLALRQDKNRLGYYECGIVVWTFFFVIKDFVNNVFGFQKLICPTLAPLILDTYSTLCLISTIILVVLFLREFKERFHSPLTGLQMALTQFGRLVRGGLKLSA